jgi:hypothetical protein
MIDHPLGIYGVFFMPEFYPWLIMLAVTITGIVVAAKS